jgi:[ribosomal protein S18]-alanine N-acetyltransferase
MPKSSNVRRLQPEDASSIQDILAQSPEAAPWSTKSLEALEINHYPAWVVERDTTLLGFLITRTLPPDEAEILNLAVTPTNRRTGAATKLLQTALAEFAHAHISRVFLEVRESNARAIHFYEQNNFTRGGRRPHYYRDPDETAVLLVRELTAQDPLTP